MAVPNYVDLVRTHPGFNRLEIGDLLFAEYTCPVNDRFFKKWSHLDCVVHALSGRKTWHTQNGSHTLRAGETLLVKKGCVNIEQYFDPGFCLIVCFLPDAFVGGIVKEYVGELEAPKAAVDPQVALLPVRPDPAISGYFQSLHAYFAGRERPSEALLRVKLRELVVGLIFSRGNPEISAYLRSLVSPGGPPLAAIMESNFTCNLSLEEFSRLCHRSLSSFKREFRREFGETPGKWLLARRLDHAAALLREGRRNVTEAAFESGFEDVSHFSRAFKQRFGEPPSRLRAEPAASSQAGVPGGPDEIEGIPSNR